MGRKLGSDRGPTEGLDNKTKKEGGPQLPVPRKQRRMFFADDEVPTQVSGSPVKLNASSASGRLPAQEPDEPVTVIAGGWRRNATGKPASLPDRPSVGTAAARELTEGPVVGWLVVVDGPGKGSSLRLGIGQNTIGRGESSRVRLEFGDHEISRETHAVVTFDPKGNRFYIQQGTGMNLTYLGESPVLAPTLLETGSRIAIGETTLCFVAFCGKDFSW